LPAGIGHDLNRTCVDVPSISITSPSLVRLTLAKRGWAASPSVVSGEALLQMRDAAFGIVEGGGSEMVRVGRYLLAGADLTPNILAARIMDRDRPSEAPQGMAEEAPPARAQTLAPPCQRCAALQAERDELKRERDELRAANREMRSAYEEHRQAQQALIEMYRQRERERDRLQRDRECERGRLQ
jgi:hypothetical protein